MSVSTALDIGEAGGFCVLVRFCLVLFGFVVCWLVCFVLLLFSSGIPNKLFMRSAILGVLVGRFSVFLAVFFFFSEIYFFLLLISRHKTTIAMRDTPMCTHGNSLTFVSSLFFTILDSVTHL